MEPRKFAKSVVEEKKDDPKSKEVEKKEDKKSKKDSEPKLVEKKKTVAEKKSAEPKKSVASKAKEKAVIKSTTKSARPVEKTPKASRGE